MITVWKCEFCLDIIKVKDFREHMRACHNNPKNKTCLTCTEHIKGCVGMPKERYGKDECIAWNLFEIAKDETEVEKKNDSPQDSRSTIEIRLEAINDGGQR